MDKSWAYVFLLFSFVGYSFCQTSYIGNQVLRLLPQTSDHINWLRDLEHQSELQLDFWSDPRRGGYPVDVHVPQESLEDFKNILEQKRIDHVVKIEELNSYIKQHLNDNNKAKAKRLENADVYNWEDYHTYEEIINWVETKATECGERCDVIDIGNTYENRTMRVIKITNGDGNEKPAFWIDAGIHAREWIAPAVATFFIDQLLNESDSDVSTFLEQYDFYVLALMNCDGYVYSYEEERMWRKSRRPNEGSTCVGTDINRNFDHEWGTVGVSQNPCSNTYCGSAPYSEVEAGNVANFVLGLPNVAAFFTLHSYGQLWMAPWGYTTDPPANKDELIRAGQFGVDALESVYGTEYTLGSASEILYSSSGTSRDWAYGVPEIEYVYTIELRDEGQYGFLLPPEQIQPCVEETWIGMKAFIRATF